MCAKLQSFLFDPTRRILYIRRYIDAVKEEKYTLMPQFKFKTHKVYYIGEMDLEHLCWLSFL